MNINCVTKSLNLINHIVKKNIYIIPVLFLFVSCSNQKNLTKDDFLRNSTIENLDKFGDFIWSIKKDSAVVINKTNLNKIKKKSRRNILWFKSLTKYSHLLIDTNYKAKNITFAQRSFIVAHLVNFEYEYQKTLEIKDKLKIESFALPIIYSYNNDDYYNEFKNNNYYNLPLFQKEHQKEYTPSLEKIDLKVNTPKLMIIEN